ncbi:MAG: hypothetical protein ACKOFU_04430, partial [Actinomycetota bacterium]
METRPARKTRFGSKIVAAFAGISLMGGVLIGCSSAEQAEGGTLIFLTNAEAWTHADPNRNYTGRDLAWFSSFMHRTLTSYM